MYLYKFIYFRLLFNWYLKMNDLKKDMKSIWMDQSPKSFGNKLDKDIKRDIVIVGGGLAGVLTAYKLSKLGRKVTLVEANTLFSGVTQYTTAHITANQGYVYTDLPYKTAELYFKSQSQAIKEYENIINQNNIECDFVKTNDYLFTIKQGKKLTKLYRRLIKFGAKVKYTQNSELIGIKTKGYTAMANQAMFNPIKFLNGLDLSGVEIFENTRVVEIDTNKKILFTKQNNITADKIIIATNYPIVNIRGLYFIKLYKSQSYAVAVKNPKKINGLYQSDIENGLTFRNYKDSVIIGGYDHRSGRIDSNDKLEKLRKDAKTYFNNDAISHYWSANDCITYDGVPLVGSINKKHHDVYVITGFNKWGITNSMISSTIITDKIEEKENEFSEIFSPSRVNFSLGAFLVNLWVTVISLMFKPLMPVFKSSKKLKNGEGDIISCEGKKAVYKDDEGKLHINSPLCKHLGCALSFNPNTNTWDCPCHGSRYDIDGNIITAPAVFELDNDSNDKEHNKKNKNINNKNKNNKNKNNKNSKNNKKMEREKQGKNNN